MAAQARRGKGKNKDHNRIKSSRTVSMCIMSLLFMMLCHKVFLSSYFLSLGLFYLPAALVIVDLATVYGALAKLNFFHCPRLCSSKHVWVVVIFMDCSLRKVLLKNLTGLKLFSTQVSEQYLWDRHLFGFLCLQQQVCLLHNPPWALRNVNWKDGSIAYTQRHTHTYTPLLVHMCSRLRDLHTDTHTIRHLLSPLLLWGEGSLTLCCVCVWERENLWADQEW